MLVPINWLKEYTDVNVDVTTFTDRMILSGSNLETVEHFGDGITGVVVGKIVSIAKHPDADRLNVCMVEVGKEAPVQIITGAENIFVGAIVPVCLDGAHIPGPLHGQPKHEEGEIINAGNLRGMLSNGMMGSCTEFGYSDKVAPYASREGIWILDPALESCIGQDFVKALNLEEDVVDFEITPNRPDCLSMIGMAREASATFGTELRYPETECKNVAPEKTEDYISVEIARPDLCSRYCCRVIKDIKIEQSPWWLQRALIYSGQRPINNIVDITNYVMLEYGQPLHAFDIDTVRGKKIIVDTPAKGTKFTTLDGTERELDGNMLCICDTEGPSCIAGVMGGLDSEITDKTKMVLVESANFNGDSVRRTAKNLGLRTEASSRNEKGIDPNLAQAACDRFCYLVELIGAGTVLTGHVDVYPNPAQPKTMDVRVSRINKVLGCDISGQQMVDYMTPLEIKCELKGDIITVTPPTVRQDLAIEEDYVEEVARMYGYDRLPVTIPRMNLEARLTDKQIMRNRAKEILRGLGVSEIQTYSFVSPKSVEKVKIAAESERRQFIKLINPLGEDTSVMRTMLLPNMMDVLYTNFSRNIPSVRFAELGNTFYNNGKGSNGLPEERYALCIGLYGEGENFYTLKGIVDELFKNFGIKNADYVSVKNDPTFHPGRCAQVVADGKVIATIGQVHPDVADNYGIAAEVYAAEIDFERMTEAAHMEHRYTPLPKYPAMKRDFAMLVKECIEVGSIMKTIKNTAGELLEDVRLFDVYRGAPVPPMHKSVAVSLTYRAKDRTLKENEINEINEKVLAALKEQYSAALREM